MGRGRHWHRTGKCLGAAGCPRGGLNHWRCSPGSVGHKAQGCPKMGSTVCAAPCLLPCFVLASCGPACHGGGWEGRQQLFLEDAVFWVLIQKHFNAKAASLSPERESDPPLLLLNTPRHIFWSSGRAPPVPQKRSVRPEARARAPWKGGPESSGHCCRHQQRGTNPEPPYNPPPGSGQNPLKPAALRHKLLLPIKSHCDQH